MHDDHQVAPDRYAHLRAQAAAQKAATLIRLEETLRLLQMQGRSVTGASIVAVGGPAFAVIRRNPEAYALYQQHRTSRQSASSAKPEVATEQNAHSGQTRKQLLRDIQQAQSERDQAVTAYTQLEERYQRLLAEHQQWGETIARLQAALVNEEFRKRLVDFAKLEQLPENEQ